MSNLYNWDSILEFVGVGIVRLAKAIFLSFINAFSYCQMETKLHPFNSVEDNELPSGKLKDLPRGIMHTRSDLELRPQWRKSLRSALYGIIRVVNFAGQSNNWTMDSSGSAVGRKESGTVPPLDKTGGDESCIIVNEAELHCHPHRQGKQKLKTTVFLFFFLSINVNVLKIYLKILIDINFHKLYYLSVAGRLPIYLNIIFKF
ncbi:hypothetical protein CXB51_025424 [Gossypium anomalum]|uniref:Uncharacterized protein n=1 Tax=Gossypium anomalum TaxID=47600 RepID=A0A8J6CSF5_9ROSI|nr:hypothetical protein CXB51_025424 [Gossypium anomalum]